METLRELLSLGRENWHFIKDVLSIVGGTATVLGVLATLTGIRKRRTERAVERRRNREYAQAHRQREDRERSSWFSCLFRHKQACWQADKVADMTVQQACGYLGDDLPDWAKEGWERVLVSDLNKPVRKS